MEDFDFTELSQTAQRLAGVLNKKREQLSDLERRDFDHLVLASIILFSTLHVDSLREHIPMSQTYEGSPPGTVGYFLYGDSDNPDPENCSLNDLQRIAQDKGKEIWSPGGSFQIFIIRESGIVRFYNPEKLMTDAYLYVDVNSKNPKLEREWLVLLRRHGVHSIQIASTRDSQIQVLSEKMAINDLLESPQAQSKGEENNVDETQNQRKEEILIIVFGGVFLVLLLVFLHH